MRFWKKSVMVALTISITGCISALKQDHTIDWSANQLYQAAKQDLNDGGYSSAIDYYTKLIARYPYGSLAQQGMLDLAYAQYRVGEPEKALAFLDNFIRSYPQHPYLDYAMYLKGVVEYERNISFFDRLAPINFSETDPEPLKRAFSTFAKLVETFPNSEYSEDARYRMVFLRNLLGQHELYAADYYLSNNAYVAAINRAQTVLKYYEQTPSAPYALAIIVRAYKELGDTKLSEDTMRVLDANFPEKRSDEEIQQYLHGNINRQKSFWEHFYSHPKI